MKVSTSEKDQETFASYKYASCWIQRSEAPQPLCPTTIVITNSPWGMVWGLESGGGESGRPTE